MVKLRRSQFLTSDGSIDSTLWLNDIASQFPPKYVDNIRQGAVAVQQLENTSLSGCLLQSFSMAEILVDLQTDPETVVAAMLSHYVQAGYLSIEHVTEQFGDVIAKLVSGVLRMDAIHTTSSTGTTNPKHNIDNLRKMLLAIIDDVRVVLIKLAEQTWLIRQAQHHASNNNIQLARDVMNIYAPLASRLGIGQLKWELEDLAFRLIDPDDYKELAKLLDTRRVDREHYVEQVKVDLRQALERAGLKSFDISGRAKHIYSIYRKMKRKDVDYSKIYDIIAVRVLTRTVEECYAGLSCVHSLWQQIPSEFDDYVSNPKPNGYRSIHTAVIGPNDKNIEVQLRTYQMHEESELGVAAHWKYKEGAGTELHFDKKIAWLRQVIEWQRDLVNQETGLTNTDIHTLFDDRVYVFTPTGEVVDLPKGSTPLDFAYHIHGQIGHRCRGSKINGSIVPLTYTLNTGECVEILTAKQPHPSRDWLLSHLGYIHTSKARHHITQWFKRLNNEEHTIERRETHEHELKHQPITPVDFTPAVVSPPRQEPIPQGAIDVAGVSNVLTSTARCCKPLPGDAVIGYITRGRGITIHRRDCVNIKRIAKPERLIDVSWGDKVSSAYPVDLVIKAHDHTDLMKDISGLLSAEKIRLLRLNTLTQHQQVIVYLSLEINDIAVLKRTLDKLRHLPGVVLAERQGTT